MPDTDVPAANYVLIHATTNLNRPVDRMVYGTTRVLAYLAKEMRTPIDKIVAGCMPDTTATPKRIRGGYCALLPGSQCNVRQPPETIAALYEDADDDYISIKVFVPHASTDPTVPTLDLSCFPMLRRLDLVFECQSSSSSDDIIPTIRITGCQLQLLTVIMIADIAPNIILGRGVHADIVNVVNRAKTPWYGVPLLLTSPTTIYVSGRAGLPPTPDPIIKHKLRFHRLHLSHGSIALGEWLSQPDYPGAHYRTRTRPDSPSGSMDPDAIFTRYCISRQ